MGTPFFWGVKELPVKSVPDVSRQWSGLILKGGDVQQQRPLHIDAASCSRRIGLILKGGDVQQQSPLHSDAASCSRRIDWSHLEGWRCSTTKPITQ